MNPPRSSRTLRVHTALAMGFAASAAPAPAAGQAAAPPATVVLHAPAEACREARLDGRAATGGADGAFTFDSVAPGAHRLTCGRALELYLLPGARLAVTLGDGDARFDGDGASANAFLHRPRRTGTDAFAALWPADTAAFALAWDAAMAADVRALNAVDDADAEFVERERMRLWLRHVWGRVTYPYFHWRETDAEEVVPDPGLAARVAGLPLADPRWWPLPEHAALVDALVHERARARLARDPALRSGDARWLRAELDAAAELFADSALLVRTATRLVLTHLDDNGSRGVDAVLAHWRALGPDSAAMLRADSLVAVDRAQREGHEIAVYQAIDGVDLELHVLRPEGASVAGPSPAMLWFHGGSGTTGTWWHSPGVVRALRENGVTVVAVEYRTGSRFDAGPLEQVADAAAAYAWVSRQADRLGVDPRRIGVAGFSSGSTLALLLGTRGVGDPLAPPPAPADRRYPAAVLVTGACPDPAGPGEDGYFRKRVARHADPAGYGPVHLVAAGQPPTLVIQASEDEYCGYDDARAFVERSAGAGNAAELVTVEGAGHFFGFYYPPGQRQMREAISDALRRWGWAPHEPPR